MREIILRRTIVVAGVAVNFLFSIWLGRVFDSARMLQIGQKSKGWEIVGTGEELVFASMFCRAKSQLSLVDHQLDVSQSMVHLTTEILLLSLGSRESNLILFKC